MLKSGIQGVAPSGQPSARFAPMATAEASQGQLGGISKLMEGFSGVPSRPVSSNAMNHHMTTVSQTLQRSLQEGASNIQSNLGQIKENLSSFSIDSHPNYIYNSSGTISVNPGYWD